ncbi:phosphate signaling complex protein PhoU [Falseniella ignava]|uniref:Phosphate-specific transport system accessory protein PhoU n=2 Tax=Falseniella ignava TaxID=137730 RepID=K1LTX8_9LACT|nr:phosphate signaling complex protein PhoU [Falseniella ignava]EKB55577.1 phosphate transport system regulatory protein PhoU [Falseniella ignava CCUG 37419]PKY90518.1 phosphate transport system regulatory protein PhoU [Falseniella ignava]
MRKSFQNELEQYRDHLTYIANAANEAIYKAIQSLNQHDQVLAEEVVNGDLKINTLAIQIEQEAYRIIALQQPVASDLRKVFAVLLASSDIERLADHASNIAGTVIRRQNIPMVREAAIDEIINQMADIVKVMLSDAIEAFIQEDATKAREVALRDNEVDRLLKEVYDQTNHLMLTHTDEDRIEIARDYVIIAKALERMGDYVTNICERIVYMESGEIVELD